jgi:hypothetical protein
MARVLFAPLSIAAGLIAGLLGRKLFEGAIFRLVKDSSTTAPATPSSGQPAPGPAKMRRRPNRHQTAIMRR